VVQHLPENAGRKRKTLRAQSLHHLCSMHLERNKGYHMEQLRRIALGLIIAYCAYSTHYIWLLNRTQVACNDAMQGQPNSQELLGAARICSAAGVDAIPMLKRVFPQTPKPKTVL
jgi:hypothetical protein